MGFSVKREAAIPSAPGSSIHVLIVEDDDMIRGACASIARSLGCSVTWASSVAAARPLLAEPIDLVLLDMRLPGENGSSLLWEIRAKHPRALVVIMTAYATVAVAVEVMRNGAGHFLQKPFSLDQIAALVAEAAERNERFAASRALLSRLQAGDAAGRLIGVSAAMQKVFRMVAKVAHTAHSLLILGEHSTGKEVVARAIHANGPHALSPFVSIDCDSLDPTHLDRSLFGCENGTSEEQHSRTGLISSAGDGTAYFSEIGALNTQAQVKLSRVLQERQIKPEGGTTSTTLRARIIASSSVSLEQMVDEGRFRKDLYYRLNVTKICVPPLRDRVEDVPLLANLFLGRQREEQSIPFSVSDQALAALLSYRWTGNVAELESTIEHACAVSSGPMLHLEDLPMQIRQFVEVTEAALAESEREIVADQEKSVIPLQDMEKHAIEHALRHFGGDKLLAAKHLKIGKTTLYRKLKEYGLCEDHDPN